MSTIQIGDKAPDFTLPAIGAETPEVHLSSFAGKKNIVLYFYPKDSTPGCTTEACDFRDNLARLMSEDTVVFGISKDSLKAHTNFITKQELNFPLLADTEGVVCELYGTWIEKSMYGRKYMGIDRSTFLIDKQGVVRALWRKVSVKGHVQEVMAEVSKI